MKIAHLAVYNDLNVCIYFLQQKIKDDNKNVNGNNIQAMTESKAVYVTKHKIREDQRLIYNFYGSERDGRVKDKNNFGSQYDSKKDNAICTCNNGIVRKHQEVRYFSGLPKQIYAYHGSRCAVDIGVGSVKALQRKQVKRIYLPETDDTGVGSSDLSSFILRRKFTKVIPVNSFFDHKKTSSKCVGGILEYNTGCVINQKLSPIIQTKSGSTSPKISLVSKRNAEIGSNTIEHKTDTKETQFETETAEVLEEVKVEKQESNGYKAASQIKSKVTIAISLAKPSVKKVSEQTQKFKYSIENTEAFKKTEKNLKPDKNMNETENFKEIPKSYKQESEKKPSKEAYKISFSKEPENAQTNEPDKLKRREDNQMNHSSDSLVQHIHNLENSEMSDEKHSRTSIPDPMENKLEREYRKMFSATKSKESKIGYEKPIPEYKSASLLRRRFEALRRGITKKEDSKKKVSSISIKPSQSSIPTHKDASVTSDPPSLISRSFSNPRKYLPGTQETKNDKYKSNSYKNDKNSSNWQQNSIESDSHGVKGMFKLWGKRFNFEEDDFGERQATPMPSYNKSPKPEKNVEPKASTNKKEKNGKKFFFFKKKSKDRTKEPIILKKDVTAGRCEIRDGLVLKIRPSKAKVKSKISEEKNEILRKTWLRKFLTEAIESARSVNVRWNNSMYATSSSTVFELIDSVYKNTGVVIKSESDLTTAESSYYKPFTKQVNFVRDIEAWMIPKTITDVPFRRFPGKIPVRRTIMKQVPLRINSDSNINAEKNMDITISDQKWYIEKSEAFSHNIEVVLQSHNTHTNPSLGNKKVSSEYFRIDIPRDFFDSSGEETMSGKRNQSSDEQVFNIVEYETNSEIRRGGKVISDLHKGDNVPTDIKGIVSVKENMSLESKISETVIKRPVDHKDVVTQGSPESTSKRCDVIGVGIITQRDMREMRKPILKIREDLTDEESEPELQVKLQKCELAQSYLQAYYRHWIPLGIDLYPWCASDSVVQTSSEKSMDGSRSCPNISEDFQTVTTVTPCEAPSIPCKHCTYEELTKRHAKLYNKMISKFRIPGKAKIIPVCCQNSNVKVKDKRIVPKDSLEVCKKRQMSNASGARCRWVSRPCGEDKFCSVPSNASSSQDGLSPPAPYCPPVSTKPCAPIPKCCKRVWMPDCTSLDDSVNRALSGKPEGILQYKRNANCDICKKARCKHAVIQPNPVCEIPAPPCKNLCDDMKNPFCMKPNSPSCNMSTKSSKCGLPVCVKPPLPAECGIVPPVCLPKQPDCKTPICPAGLLICTPPPYHPVPVCTDSPPCVTPPCKTPPPCQKTFEKPSSSEKPFSIKSSSPCHSPPPCKPVCTKSPSCKSSLPTPPPCGKPSPPSEKPVISPTCIENSKLGKKSKSCCKKRPSCCMSKQPSCSRCSAISSRLPCKLSPGKLPTPCKTPPHCESLSTSKTPPHSKMHPTSKTPTPCKSLCETQSPCKTPSSCKHVPPCKPHLNCKLPPPCKSQPPFKSPQACESPPPCNHVPPCKSPPACKHTPPCKSPPVCQHMPPCKSFSPCKHSSPSRIPPSCKTLPICKKIPCRTPPPTPPCKMPPPPPECKLPPPCKPSCSTCEKPSPASSNIDSFCCPLHEKLSSSSNENVFCCTTATPCCSPPLPIHECMTPVKRRSLEKNRSCGDQPPLACESCCKPAPSSSITAKCSSCLESPSPSPKDSSCGLPCGPPIPCYLPKLPRTPPEPCQPLKQSCNPAAPTRSKLQCEPKPCQPNPVKCALLPQPSIISKETSPVPSKIGISLKQLPSPKGQHDTPNKKQDPDCISLTSNLSCCDRLKPYFLPDGCHPSPAIIPKMAAIQMPLPPDSCHSAPTSTPKIVRGSTPPPRSCSPNRSKISGVHLRMEPYRIEDKSCSDERAVSHGNITMKIKEQTPSTQEIREPMNVRVQDEDGSTLYERKDYVCENQRDSVLDDVYRASKIHIASTPVTVRNMITDETKNNHTASEPSQANLIEINLKLRIVQGDKITEVDVGNINEAKRNLNSDIKKSVPEIFIVNSKTIEQSEVIEETPKNDINIKITLKNFKPQHKMVRSADKTCTDEFSKNISEKFHTVSTGYSDVEEENVFSIHRATFNLASSVDVSDTCSKISHNITSKDVSDIEPNLTVSSSSVDVVPTITDVTEDENVEEIINAESTKSELPDFNDIDERDSVLTGLITSNECTDHAMSKRSSKEQKKVLLKKVFQKVSKKSKNKENVRELREMLKIILTDSSAGSETNMSSNELAKDVTYTSLKPNYFRDTDSMNNYYKIESNYSSQRDSRKEAISSSGEPNTSSSKGSDESDANDITFQGCMCSKVAEKLNNANIAKIGGCCCRSNAKQDEETNCDLRNADDYFLLNYKAAEYVDVEIQNSRHLSSHINSFNLSVQSNTKKYGNTSEKTEVFEKISMVRSQIDRKITAGAASHRTKFIKESGISGIEGIKVVKEINIVRSSSPIYSRTTLKDLTVVENIEIVSSTSKANKRKKVSKDIASRKSVRKEGSGITDSSIGKESERKNLYQNTPVGIFDEEQINILSHKLDELSAEREKEESEKKLESSNSMSHDILQSYAAKKAVLQIYAEETENGSKYVAKLPKFVLDRESELAAHYAQLASNSFKSVFKENVFMMSVRR